MKGKLTALIAVLFHCGISSSALAYTVTLDWNSVNWTAATGTTTGSTQSFDIDPLNPGNDITIAITTTGANSRINTGANAINDSSVYTGGFGAGQESLRIGANHTANNNAAVNITITFLYTSGVNSVSTTVFDIDTLDNNGNPNPDQFRDQLDRFTGVNNGSTVVPVATLTRSSFNNDDTTANRVRGDRDGNNGNNHSNDRDREAASNEGLGNVGISFGPTTVDEVSFRWTNRRLNGQQAIALYDITYVVPEASSWIAGVLLITVLSFQCSRTRKMSL